MNYDAGSGSWRYDNSSSNCYQYGKLYDWKTAKTVAPQGWHLPSKSEFETLLNNLGGSGANAYKQIINNGSSGFNALFGGWRYDSGDCSYMGSDAYFWSATEGGHNNAWYLNVDSNDQKASLYFNSKPTAFSVRLVKD